MQPLLVNNRPVRTILNKYKIHISENGEPRGVMGKSFASQARGLEFESHHNHTKQKSDECMIPVVKSERIESKNGDQNMWG